MPRRSKIDLLPESVRKEFERRLIEGCFSDYEGVALWLQEQGYDISRSAAHRWGQGFQRAQAAVKAATDMATALTEHIGDDAGKILDASQRIYMGKILQVLLDMEDLSPENIDFLKLGRAIADITKTAIPLKKHMDEVELRKKTEQAAANIETRVRASLPEETLKMVLEEVYNIVPNP
ncbi:MAG: hypothetical protein A4E68_01925 [Syntrophaceae bacterium PtaB.Bin095]|jgi:hypothetical protein|nr:MAG: hypothetical protein A4E68_01925 [Syntrophaceae bacterium PtaB.Bin095]